MQCRNLPFLTVRFTLWTNKGNSAIIYVTVYVKRDHFTRALNQFAERQFQSGKKKIGFEFFFFFNNCTRSRAFQLAPRQISQEVSLVWLS